MVVMRFSLPNQYDTSTMVYKPTKGDIETMKQKYQKLSAEWMVLWDLVYRERGLDFDIRAPTDESSEIYIRFIQKYGSEVFEQLKKECLLCNPEYNVRYISYSALRSKIAIRLIEWGINECIASVFTT